MQVTIIEMRTLALLRVVGADQLLRVIGGAHVLVDGAALALRVAIPSRYVRCMQSPPDTWQMLDRLPCWE